MTSFLFGMLGGIAAWLATTILGQPIYKFISLRSLVAVTLARYDQQVVHDEFLAPEDFGEQWLEARKKEYLECGGQLIAFHASNAFIVRVLRRLPARWRCYPKAAGSNFLLLAEIPPVGVNPFYLKKSITRELKLKF